MTKLQSTSTARKRAGAPLALVCILCSAAALGAPLQVRLAFVGERASDAHLGAQQGLAEANAQGRFLGQQYTLAVVADAAAARALPAAAVIAALHAADLPALADGSAGVPVLNTTATDSALRAVCLPNLFHTIPSTDMLADAVQQWRRKAPQSSAAAGAWHPSFEKYAAVQLNRRYQEAHGRAMSDAAWAGWAAVKLLSDTVARLGSADPTALAVALRTSLAFDGQKGTDLSFRSTGQLRQPLLLIENDVVVGEAPVRPFSDDLDSLGLTECAK